MREIVQITKRLLICAIASVLILSTTSPVIAQEITDPPAEDVTTSEQVETPPAEEQPPVPEPTPKLTATAVTPGPTTPSGPSASSYTQNAAGQWENDYYIWDPVTKQTKPKTPQEYSYNPSTGMWDTVQWIYSPEQKKYIPDTVSTTINPYSQIQSTGPGSSNSLAGATNDPLISNTGPNSTNSVTNNSTLNGTFDLFYNAQISNTLSSNATSGDAAVQGNTLGGDALSGDAASIANILDMLNSSWLGSSQNIANFVANIDGDVVGDLYVDPNALPYTLNLPPNTNLTVNSAETGNIDNDINLNARSGDATVDSNTTGGNATSGDAQAMANIINMMNSSIAAGKSFIGLLNIDGNYDGDILLPPGMLENLIAETGPNSTNTIDGDQTNNIAISKDTTSTINNTIDAEATSGNALIDSNTSAGDATTGTATTKVNDMNLIGQNMTGKNALLVFVNVFGKWIGMLVGAPSGSNNILATGPDSTNTTDSSGVREINLNDTRSNTINNDVQLTAESGGANVTNNTKGGNAKTGDADVSVNLLNMIDSHLAFSDWFGVLFINVFGSWNGSFGVDTAAGTKLATQTTSSSITQANNQVFNFVPAASQFHNVFANEIINAQVTNNQSQQVSGATTKDSNNGPTTPSNAATINASSVAGSNNQNLQLAVAGMAALFILAIPFIERFNEWRAWNKLRF